MQRPRIDDVARHAGLSTATVSRALRGLPNVSPDARERVMLAAEALGYHIDRQASRLASGRTETIAVVVPDPSTWYFSRVIAGVESAVRGRRDVIVLAVPNIESRRSLVAGPAPLWKRVDGLVFVDVLLEQKEQEILVDAPVAVVMVGQRSERFPFITNDDRTGSALATSHLIGLGHERIAFLGAPGRTALPFIVEQLRLDGFRDAMAAAGLAVNESLVVAGPVSVDRGAAAMASLMSASVRPTAVVASSDELAFGAWKMAQELGYSVPGDVSLIGFDDHGFATVIGLTTIRQDPFGKGVLAATRLLASDGLSPFSAEPSGTYLTTELVVRRSTARPGDTEAV